MIVSVLPTHSMRIRNGLLFPLASLIILSVDSQRTQAQACSGCGCRGGPGYRAPSGQCVSWRALARTCGTPPETRCKAEMVNAWPGGQGSAKRPERPSPPQREHSAPQNVPNPF